MIDYGTLDNVDGAFPNAAPEDVSAPAAGDGTKVEAAWVQQTWGFFQQILDYVGGTPDTVNEAAGASQLHDALKTGLSPVGMIVGWHGADDPDTISDTRLLPCVGQTVAIADYAELTAQCYIGNGNNLNTDFPYWYKSSDAGGVTRDNGGAYITVADLRGAFLRGRDTTATRDPEGATREFPDVQDDEMLIHDHKVESETSGVQAYPLNIGVTTGLAFYDVMLFHGSGSNDLHATDLPPGTPSNATETRPINVNTLWCIRY